METEKKVSHTPGPWSVDTTERDWPCVMAPDEWIIAEINITYVTTLEEEISNAKLIAAAPELLEALRDLTQYLSSVFDPEDLLDLPELIEKAHTAIRKATE